MMKFKISLWLSLLLLTFSCNKNDDIGLEEEPMPGVPVVLGPEIEINEVNNFIYNTMNKWYLYKDEQPLLANDHFSTTEEKIDFINNGGTPEEFFELLKIDQDEFSQLKNNANLHARFLSSTHGFRSNIVRVNGTEIIGAVLQVYKGSVAESLGLKRGDLFNKIDGIRITEANVSDLLSKNSFALGRALSDGLDADGKVVFQDLDEVTISIESIEESPIVVSKTLNIDGTSIGYLFYKYFENVYNNDLNDEFAVFKANGVNDFVIDLRYNSGGNELALLELASMLTGQFDGELFLEERYNDDIQGDIDSGLISVNVNNNFRSTLTDGTAINSLGLSKLYVITSDVTASSSELLIHCLRPYIDVVVIGEEEGTRGKGVSKREIYDAQNPFSKEGINTSHNYSLDLVRIEGLNKNGEALNSDSGILPTLEGLETVPNLGELGDENEKLLKIAIDNILGR